MCEERPQTNKILLFCFCIVLQYHHIFTIILKYYAKKIYIFPCLTFGLLRQSELNAKFWLHLAYSWPITRHSVRSIYYLLRCEKREVLSSTFMSPYQVWKLPLFIYVSPFDDLILFCSTSFGKHTYYT